jgi:predicted nucleic acid-binding protein
MAAAVLVDSNYYIRRQRQDRDPFDELAAFADTHEFLTCGMVVMEVLRGMHHNKTRESYRMGFSVMNYVPTTSGTWDLATDIALSLDRKGTPIPPQDSLIAAHALHTGAAVLTFDTDFRRVPGLTVLDRLP